MFEDKRCDVSLGLEPSLRAGSLYVCGIIKVGRNATAFLGNAADKRRMRTIWGSVHGILCPGPLCRRYKRCEKSLGLGAVPYSRMKAERK